MITIDQEFVEKVREANYRIDVGTAIAVEKMLLDEKYVTSKGNEATTIGWACRYTRRGAIESRGGFLVTWEPASANEVRVAVYRRESEKVIGPIALEVPPKRARKAKK